MTMCRFVDRRFFGYRPERPLSPIKEEAASLPAWTAMNKKSRLRGRLVG